MSKGDKPLAALREELNRIDDALHDLIMERATVAEYVRAQKHNNAVWRPAREAQILRRLLMRHEGPFPHATIVQIWREIVSAMVRLQDEFRVAVYSTETSLICRQLVRDHFGNGTPVLPYTSTQAVLKAVEEGAVTIGVLPIPQNKEKEPWWTSFGDRAGGDLTVCAKLPFVQNPQENEHAALCVGNIPPEESGKDKSLYIFRTKTAASREKLAQKSAAAGIKFERLIHHRSSFSGSSVFLTELDGYVPPGDPRVARLIHSDTVAADAVVFLGTYAAPLELSDFMEEKRT
ncbi:MAG: chorismate mutase [Pseudomonadota bacterium]|nr:chorismate mutase [Pseudomonadota bacterium]